MTTLPSAPHSRALPALRSLLPGEAWQVIQSEKDGVVFVDIRSELEHFFVGHPPGVINIPWQDAPDWEVEPGFVEDVARIARRDQHVVLICRSGHRSIDAGNVLLQSGFHKVSHVVEGFEGDRDERYHRSSVNGWRFYGLPWVQC